MATDSQENESEASSMIPNISSIFGFGKESAPKDNLADYDLSNFLTIFSIKLPEDNLKSQYKEALDNLIEWQAWEANNIEKGVVGKINTRELPSDTSLASALKRHGFRRAVLQVCREQGRWLTQSSIDSSAKSYSCARGDATSNIVRYVCTPLPSTFRGFRTVLCPIVRCIVQDALDKQSLTFSFARNSYDTTMDRISTTISQVYVEIGIKKEVSDKVEISIKQVVSSFNFDHSKWEAQSKTVKMADLVAGKAILPRYTINLAEL